MMGDMSLQTFLLRLLALAPILALAGWTAAFVAAQLGEDAPRHDGRLTLNPFAHLDWAGGAGFMVAGLGWMQPVCLDYRKLRGGVLGVLAVIFAVEAVLVALAFGAVWLLPLAINSASFSSAPIMAGGLVALARGAVGFGLFNLLPLPPLLAGQVFLAVPKLQKLFGHMLLPVGLALLVFVVTGLPGRWLTPAIDTVLGLLSSDAPILLRRF